MLRSARSFLRKDVLRDVLPAAVQGSALKLGVPSCDNVVLPTSSYARYHAELPVRHIHDHVRDWRSPASSHLFTSAQGHQQLGLGFHRSISTSAITLADHGEHVTPVDGNEQLDMEATQKVKEVFGDLEQYEGLPPLSEILNEDQESEAKAARRAAELQKQEEMEKSRVRKVDEQGRAYGLGRRKTSTARVFVWENDGKESPSFSVNDRLYTDYFPLLEQRTQLLQPFLCTETIGRFNIQARVHGGGLSSQAGAIMLGTARALQNFEPSWRKTMKGEGLMTRDQRMVERKKPGKPKARKSFQWVKR